MCGRDIQCSLARKRREETRKEKDLKMRLKEMEAEFEKFKYVLGVMRLAFVDFNISGDLRRKISWSEPAPSQYRDCDPGCYGPS